MTTDRNEKPVEKTRPCDAITEGEMKTLTKVGVLVVSMCLVTSAAGLNAAEKKESAGAKLFQEKCAACHPDGGNIIKPSMTLRRRT